MEKFINLLKNRYFKCILIVIIAILCLKLYTNYLFESLNNETPREAIVEFIYDKTHSWKSFFIEIEESKNIDKTDENSLYYNIKYNGWYSIPGDLGGTIEVKKINNQYYVIKYIGYC